MKKIYYNILNYLSKWKFTKLERGYTILLCLPANLPCMTFLSVNYLKKLNLKNCKEILIVLDSGKDLVTPLLKDIRFSTPFKVIKSNKILKYICRISNSPFKYHWLQIFTGLNECKTKWLLLKGCNLYFKDINIYENYYRFVNSRNLILSGIKYRVDIHKDLIGTYEMFINTNIKKICKPIELIATVKNKKQYDTLLFIQKRILGELGYKKVIKLYKVPKIIHISYVISSYRQIFKYKQFNDDSLRFWFLVLMNELLTNTKWFNSDFINLKKYYSNFSRKLDRIYTKKNIYNFLNDVYWVVNQNNLDLHYAKKEIEKIKKNIIFKNH